MGLKVELFSWNGSNYAVTSTPNIRVNVARRTWKTWVYNSVFSWSKSMKNIGELVYVNETA